MEGVRKTGVRLQPLTSSPRLDDLIRALELAKQNSGQPVQLPWFLHDRSRPYMLTVLCSPDRGEPGWELLGSSDGRPHSVFRHETADVGHVLSLVNAECTAANQAAQQPGAEPVTTHAGQVPQQPGAEPVMTHAGQLPQQPPAEPVMTHAGQVPQQPGAEPMMTHAGQLPQQAGAEPVMTHAGQLPQQPPAEPVMTHAGQPLQQPVAESSIAIASQSSQPEPIEHPVHMQVQTGQPKAVAAAKTRQTHNRLKAPKKTAGLTLAGDLSDIEADGLLQGIALGKMTGRLGLTNPLEKLDIYFEEGVPVHAAGLESLGEEAVIEMLMWDSGRFQFHPGDRTVERTIKKRLEAILVEGATIVDYNSHLTKAGVSMDCYLLRKFPQLTEEQFEQRLTSGLGLDATLQKRLYKQIDHRSTLLDILRRKPMSKAAWIPIMYNLLSCDLIQVSDKPTLAAKRAALQSVDIDQALVTAAAESMLTPETGLTSYPMFLHLLGLEFERFQRTNAPFSLLIMDATVLQQPLSSEILHIVSQAIEPVKRGFDVFAHYKNSELCMLLPHSDVTGASLFAKALLNTLLKLPFGGSLNLSIGIAGIPEDCKTPGQLLGAATEARERAQQQNTPIVIFRNLYR